METNSIPEIKTQLKKFLTTDPFYSETISNTLSDEENLISSGILDSIGIFNLIVFIESHFSISVTIGEMSEANFQNLNQISHFIHTKL